MLNIGKERVPLCEGPSRRSFLQLGTTGMATLSLPTLFKLEALGAVKNTDAKIRNCITIFGWFAWSARYLGYETRCAR